MGLRYSACWKTLRKVLVMLYKALRSGVTAAINCLKKMVPGCCAGGFKKLIQEIYESLRESVQGFIQNSLKERGVPKEVVDKVDWTLIEDTAKLGQPKAKDKQF